MDVSIMRTISLFTILTAAFGGTLSTNAPPPPARLNVVATTPDLGALARAIGGDQVEVKVLAKPTEDPHFVDASRIVTLNRRRADRGRRERLSWLPPLMESARNSKIASGARGRIVASQGIEMIEVPATFDRSKGDIHALGNPHFLIDPVRAKAVATHVAEQLAKVQPASADVFMSNLKAFNAALDAKYAEWQKQLEPFKGAKIVTYHRDFVYLAERFNLSVLETLEPKPGIAPSPSHLAQVISAMRNEKARVILVQPYQNREEAETVSQRRVVLDAAAAGRRGEGYVPR
jgi:zinc/manganese transport system substrate-binding protein